jgi:DNA-binding response OmpR family regulator
MSSNLDVLVVDDNASIRELLLHALSPLAAIETVASAADALHRAGARPPDLVISDYRMPGLNGLELLSSLAGTTPRPAVVMMASRADLAGAISGCRSLVEEFIEKPFFVEEATARIKRVLDRIELGKATRDAADSTSVRGTLAQMSVMDLLQTVDIGRKSCVLTLTHKEGRCEMIFHDGQLMHAALGKLSGEPAVYKAVFWNDGSFQIDFERKECQRTITHSTQSVLMEALRLFDEAQRDGEDEGAQASGAGFGGGPSGGFF